MIVAVSRIPLPKTERYLYWVRVAYKTLKSLIYQAFQGFFFYLPFCRNKPKKADFLTVGNKLGTLLGKKEELIIGCK